MAARDEEDEVGVGDSDDSDSGSEAADGDPAERGESKADGGGGGGSCSVWRRQYLGQGGGTEGGGGRRGPRKRSGRVEVGVEDFSPASRGGFCALATYKGRGRNATVSQWCGKPTRLLRALRRGSEQFFLQFSIPSCSAGRRKEHAATSREKEKIKKRIAWLVEPGECAFVGEIDNGGGLGNKKEAKSSHSCILLLQLEGRRFRS